MTRFVIGATGWIGAALHGSLGATGPVVGTSSAGSETLIPFRLETPQAFPYDRIQPGDTVFVTAAISSPDRCAHESAWAWEVNVTGTSAFIAEAIARSARVIFFSSDAVYGEVEEGCTEEDPCRPVGAYGEMKRAVEIRFLGHPCFKTVRLSYVMARDDRFTRYLRECADRGSEAEVFHPLDRAVVHKQDVLSAVCRLGDDWDAFPSPCVNLAGPAIVSRVDIARAFAERYAPDLRYRIVEPDAAFYAARPRRIAMRSTGFAPLLGRPPHTVTDILRHEFP